jgi:flagellar biosynthetic protein FliP
MRWRGLLAPLLVALLWAGPALAEPLSINLGGDGPSVTGRIIQLVALITVLSLAPSILVMVTAFTRIVVVLSFVRTALGTAQTPPNQVLVALALFLTLFVMTPTFQRAYDNGIHPLIAGDISEGEAFDRTVAPFAAFMEAHVRAQDVALFTDLAATKGDGQRDSTGDATGADQQRPGADANDTGAADTAAAPPLRVLIPAFIISELRRAFEIGFLIFVPFLIIDMVVASVLMSMGMMMLPPVMIALPFKLIFFVLVDGWYLVVGSLVRSYGG